MDGEAPICVFPERTKTCEPDKCVECTVPPCNDQCADAPCRFLTCDKPPPPACNNQNLEISLPTGRCSETGACVYNKITLPCPNGCDNGTCKTAPCQGVICNTPPPNYCDNDTAVTWHPIGRCNQEGRCVYTRSHTPCTEGCESGHCRERHPCETTTCQSPPANYCLDGSTLFAFDAAGICEDDGTTPFCHYPGREIACADRCEAGACIDAPCEGVRCTAPPAPYCEDAETLRTLASTEAHRCENGVCIWEMVDIHCESGCSDGQCNGDPCVGMTPYCHQLTLSPNYCNGLKRVTFPPTGQCEAGTCRYNLEPFICNQGCELGACTK